MQTKIAFVLLLVALTILPAAVVARSRFRRALSERNREGETGEPR
ncbi:MAG: hypothetical protein ABIW83_08995 [Allosphingosinicella sp.]